MLETLRVQPWRQQQGDEGKVQVVLGQPQTTKMHLEALCQDERRTAAEIVQRALAAYHSEAPAAVDATEQLRQGGAGGVHALQ